MHIRRIILYLAAAFLWATYDPDMAGSVSMDAKVHQTGPAPSHDTLRPHALET